VALPADLKQKLKLDQDGGIMLLGLEPDGPAATGGLILGDVLLAAGRESLSNPEVLTAVLDRAAIGETVDFRVLRAGTIREVKIRIGERRRREK
jgi:S1-C subfamily serine protease